MERSITNMCNTIFKQGDIWTARLQGYLTASFPHLGHLSLPRMMIQLYAMACRIRINLPMSRKSLMAEFCSGTAWITKSCLQKKMPACCYDAKYRAHLTDHNVYTAAGFRAWIL
jgi:hypothetical protein